jgi:hypothetical protein
MISLKQTKKNKPIIGSFLCQGRVSWFRGTLVPSPVGTRFSTLVVAQYEEPVDATAGVWASASHRVL